MIEHDSLPIGKLPLLLASQRSIGSLLADLCVSPCDTTMNAAQLMPRLFCKSNASMPDNWGIVAQHADEEICKIVRCQL
jgi:hypothetical protein